MNFLFRKKKPSPAAGDAAVIAALKKHGVDLTQRRSVQHYLYFPREDEAQAAAAQLRSDGFDVEVKPAALGSSWLALATHNTVVDESTIAALRARFEALVTPTAGEYDGWEAAVDAV